MNNTALFDAAIIGLSGGAQERWLTDSNANSYQTFVTAVMAFAAAVDDAIEPIAGGPSMNEINLMQSLCQGVAAQRMITSGQINDYNRIAAALAALFQEIRGELDTTSLTSDNIENVSNVPGNTVTEALNALLVNPTSLTSDDIENVSNVSGDDVTEALDTLNVNIGALDSDDIDNESAVTGANVTEALDTLNDNIVALDSDDIDNESAVTGANVTEALNTLNAKDAAQIEFSSVIVPGTDVQEGIENAGLLPWLWAAAAAPATTALRYFQRNYGAASGTESTGIHIVPRTCTVHGITISMLVPLTTDSITFTLRRAIPGGVLGNTVATGVLPPATNSMIITGFGSLVLSAGDKISMQIQQSGTEAQVTWGGCLGLF